MLTLWCILVLFLLFASAVTFPMMGFALAAASTMFALFNRPTFGFDQSQWPVFAIVSHDPLATKSSAHLHEYNC
jgi:hypothetical protein